MAFFSLLFVLFLAASLVVSRVVVRFAPKLNYLVLLSASIYFYLHMARPETLQFLFATAALTWLTGLALERLENAVSKARKVTKDKAEKKRIKARYTHYKQLVLVACLLVSFGFLAYIKYWNTLLFLFGMAPSANSLGLLLPLGISFYTFQSVSFVIDVYRGQVQVSKNPLKHLLFVSWFPALVQGPINRYAELAPALFEAYEAKSIDFERALSTLGYGLFKKYVVANLAAPMISSFLTVGADSSPGSLNLLIILLYSIQQYADFSGGIDLVTGISALFGVPLAQNFRRPYFATSLGDFWRRWHISLGRWMRDYLFYPFALTRPMRGLSRVLEKRKLRHLARTLPAALANIVVFCVVGIWHGPEPHFLVWGLYNGLVIAAADLLSPFWAWLKAIFQVDDTTRSWHVFRVIRTFAIVNIGWYFDRIENVGESFVRLYTTFTNFKLDSLEPIVHNFYHGPKSTIQLLLLVIGTLIIFAVSLTEELYAGKVERRRLAGDNDAAAPTMFDILQKRSYITRCVIYGTMGALFIFSFILNLGGGFMYANY